MPCSSSSPVLTLLGSPLGAHRPCCKCKNTKPLAVTFKRDALLYDIKNIAYVCGFSNESAFCTTFKNRLGVTPSEYRLNLQRS